MERLSGLDASFLYGETPETPTHTAPLWIFDSVPEGKSPFQSFREHIKARLHLLPFFHRKLVLSPIQLDHPVWIDDDDIDLDYHVCLIRSFHDSKTAPSFNAFVDHIEWDVASLALNNCRSFGGRKASRSGQNGNCVEVVVLEK